VAGTGTTAGVGAIGVTGAVALEDTDVPATVNAVTVNVYAVPLVKPVTVAVVAPVVVANCPPEEITRYPVMTDPPLLVGAVHDTDTCPSPAIALAPVGAPGATTVEAPPPDGVGAGVGAGVGGPVGVIALDAIDAGEVVVAFVAVTVNVYAVPLVNPDTVAVVAPVVVAVNEPGAEVTVYEAIAEEPGLADAVHDTVAAVLPATALTPVGDTGLVADGVTALDALDATDVPDAFVAVTVNVYGVSLVNPDTVAVVAPVVVAVNEPGAEVTV